MPRKKINHSAIEQKEFRVFNPETIKQTVEIAVKPRPSIEELETIEKVGKKQKPKKTRKTKTAKPEELATIVPTNKPINIEEKKDIFKENIWG